MSENTNSRRDFMKSATLGAAGVVIASRASSYANILGANDRVRVGIVGYSDRCRQALIPSFMIHAKELNFDFVAVSDVWGRRRDEGAEAIGKLVGHEIAKTRNNEELYDRKDVTRAANGKYEWMKMGGGIIDYVGQYRALRKDGYRGVVSLETHWRGAGTPEESSRQSMAGMKDLLRRAGAL